MNVLFRWPLRANPPTNGDIKPENIMLVDNVLKATTSLIDFGLACHVSQARVGSLTGSTWYKAPELLLGLPYTGAIHVWALGRVALDLFSGYPIYPGDSDYQMVQYIMDTLGPFPYDVMVSGINTEQFFTRSSNLKGAEEDPLHCVDPLKGISPQALLDHPFSTAPAVVVGRRDNAGHIPASQDQSSCGNMAACETLNTSVGTKVALVKASWCPNRLSEASKERGENLERGETDSGGDRNSRVQPPPEEAKV